MKWATLCAIDELCDGGGKYVELDGFHLAVFKDGAALAVIDDACPHAGASLSAGIVREGCAVCPRHEWHFNLTDGQVRHLPGAGVRVYETRIIDRNGRKWLQAALPIF